MENASKALLIAGAILIAIVLISLGVMILGQGSESIKNNNMNDSEIAAYNSEYEAFLGTNVRGNTVRQLVNKVTQHNRSNSSDFSKQIGVATTGSATAKKDWTSAATVASATSFGTGFSYKVEAQYSTGGLISNFIVTKNN